MKRTSSPRVKSKSRETWNPDLDAEARAQLVRAFNELTAVHHYPVVAAARMLGISPSLMSGKNSLPFRYGAGGTAALRLIRRTAPDSRIGKITRALQSGGEIVFKGRVLGGPQ